MSNSKERSYMYMDISVLPEMTTTWKKIDQIVWVYTNIVPPTLRE